MIRFVNLHDAGAHARAVGELACLLEDLSGQLTGRRQNQGHRVILTSRVRLQ